MSITKPSSLVIVAASNIVILCLAQFIYAVIMDGDIAPNHFQLVLFPLILVMTNLVLWFTKYRVAFFLHWFLAYIGYVCAFIILYGICYIRVIPIEDMPPGEAYFDLFLTAFILLLIQGFILLCLNGMTYILYRGDLYIRKEPVNE